MPTSITFDEFTWTVAETRTVGRFLFGDPFVWSATTLTEISPACEVVNIIAPSINISTPADYIINGSMKNPVPHGQYGFSSMIDQYVEAGNVARALPLSLVGNDSIVSSICYTTQPQTNQTHVRKVAILTVLPSAPADLTDGAYFCPHPYGSGTRELIRVDAVNWSFIPRRAALPSSVTLSQMQGYLTGLPAFEYHSAWWGYASIPAENLGTVIADSYSAPSTYGKDRQDKYQALALGIQTDIATVEEIRQVVLHIIQDGIHIIGASLNGLKWEGNGSHRQGRWFPALVAATMLGRQDWLDHISSDDSYFQERGNTWFVGYGDIGRVTNSGRTWVTSQLGMPEWGIQHNHTPATDDPAFWEGDYQEYNGWPAPEISIYSPHYRHVNWGPQVGIAIALRSMGMVTQAAHPPFFAYEERLFNITVGNYDLASTIGAFRAAYIDDFGPLGPEAAVATPPAGIYTPGRTIRLASISSGAAIHLTSNGTTPTSASPLHASPFTLSGNVTLKWIVVDPEYAYQPESSAIYTVDTSGAPAPPNEQQLSIPRPLHLP